MEHNQPAQILTTDKEILPLLKQYRKEGKKIVLTQGVFDLVHIGHARYCQEAKKYGDVLIVGVDSDEKVRARKGPDRPIVPQEERLEMLTYLRAVDAVILKQLNEPKFHYIKLIKPDVLVVTRENYTPDKVTALKALCTKVVVLDPMATTSTSAKIRRLQIGAAKKIGETLSTKLITTIEEVLRELKGDVHVESSLPPSRSAKKNTPQRTRKT